MQTNESPTLIRVGAVDCPSSVQSFPISTNTASSCCVELHSASRDGDKPAGSDINEGHNGSFEEEDWEEACNNFFEDISADAECNSASSIKKIAMELKPPERSSSSNVIAVSNITYQTKGNTELRDPASAASPRSAHRVLDQNTITPSRSKFLAHVSPVALISPRTGNFYGASKESWRNGPNKMSGAYLIPSCHSGNSTSPSEIDCVTFIRETPPFSETERHKHIYCYGNELEYIPMPLTTSSGTLKSPDCIKEMPPEEQIKETDSFNKAKGGSASPSLNPTPSVQQTPSAISQSTTGTACASKRRGDSGYTNSSAFGAVVPRGGKITPPLCRCGKRTKRKTVVTPGPNEGVPFYVCPNGRGHGLKRQSCGYFRWEVPPSADITCKPVLSDYGE